MLGTLFFILIIIFSCFLIYVSYNRVVIQKRIKERERADKLAVMREAGQCCANCKYRKSYHGFFADECRRHPDGYDPVTGTARLHEDNISYDACKHVVGTKQCGWEAM